MVSGVLGLLFERAVTLAVALPALTFPWGIGFSQLYHAPRIDATRSTLPGRLLLGSTFNWLVDKKPKEFAPV